MIQRKMNYAWNGKRRGNTETLGIEIDSIITKVYILKG